eukprot:TRINITY_DN18224_c0_g1_i1.p1 TRINITY_DN18224_c0_g1~~TRINITY_DN18224_c0_g1_i1.p1  ORF type:complete len:440 (+),score=123.13 TRINITY_DN18224_c0_g1_i1:238-1557(+)
MSAPTSKDKPTLGQYMGALSLLIFAPWFVIFLWQRIIYFDGTLPPFTQDALSQWLPMLQMPTTASLKILFGFMAIEALFMKYLHGEIYEGPGTGHDESYKPLYHDNAVLSFTVTQILLIICITLPNTRKAMCAFFDDLVPVIYFLCVASLVLCVYLYLKGMNAPNGSGVSTGVFVFDFYWGIELYPYFFGLNLKQLINCRIGMMGWTALLWVYAAKHIELQATARGTFSNALFVSIFLQLVYIAKFYYWESGYMWSMDVQFDRFGFYIGWGCLVWLPSIYTAASLHLVQSSIKNDISTPVAIAVTIAGLIFIFVNYSCDEQRQRARALKGKTTFFGKPAKFITATYTTDAGDKRTSILLTNGWWGVARHFHYVPEWLAACCWTHPVLYPVLLPYTYVIFLFILLVQRSMRDDAKCRGKYGKFWTEYCKKVPYVLVPGIY